MWRRRWRNSNLTDPIYRDVIETEIGGATVPAYALSSRVSRVQSLRGSIADNTPASLQGSVGNEQFSAHMRQGDLPPTYNDVVVERRQTLLASTEKPDKKKDNE
ncbi:hypothetical protein GGF49_002122 [Coemansia sp. RSA 1853]|nr:hypothetical protein LPJ76_002307 [Coemansia sp. RSA 638]KAJ2543337.1 hypothetical protein GGF49_002122 [Coemansia sp. RSA 1853]